MQPETRLRRVIGTVDHGRVAMLRGWCLAGAVAVLVAAGCGGANDDAGRDASTTGPAPPGPSTTLPTSGRVASPSSTPGPAAACPPVDDGGAPAGLVAFDAATGAFAWEAVTSAMASVATAADVVVLADPSSVRALDIRTGEQRWCQAGGGQVAAGGTTVAVARPGEAVIGVDASTGEQRWQSDVVTPATDGSDPAAALLGLTMAGGEDTIYLRRRREWRGGPAGAPRHRRHHWSEAVDLRAGPVRLVGSTDAHAGGTSGAGLLW